MNKSGKPQITPFKLVESLPFQDIDNILVPLAVMVTLLHRGFGTQC